MTEIMENLRCKNSYTWAILSIKSHLVLSKLQPLSFVSCFFCGSPGNALPLPKESSSVVFSSGSPQAERSHPLAAFPQTKSNILPKYLLSPDLLPHSPKAACYHPKTKLSRSPYFLPHPLSHPLLITEISFFQNLLDIGHQIHLAKRSAGNKNESCPKMGSTIL